MHAYSTANSGTPIWHPQRWMGSTHFLTKTLDRVSTEMSVHVLAYNFKKVMNLLGTPALMNAIGQMAPEILPYEIGNALTAMVKRKQITQNEAVSVFGVTNQIPVRLTQVDIPQALNLYFERSHFRFSALLFCPIAALRQQLRSLLSRLALEQNNLAIKAENMTARSIVLDFNIYAYDAYFLHCAKSSSCPLITLDNRMKQVAIQLNIELLE